jgi:cytochrome c biogenesis protein CcmG/thiol:disulfide interchange protein DsbE
MTVRQQWSAVAAIVGAIGLGLFAAVHVLGSELFPVTIGSRAPDFRAHRLGRPDTMALASYKGRVVVLNIWATWCEPCRVEMPSLEALYRTYGPAGLKIVAVSVDDAVPEDSIRAFARNFGLTFDILHDSTHTIERIYQSTGYPETFVIGKDGTIRQRRIGAANWASPSSRALVAELLGPSSE